LTLCGKLPVKEKKIYISSHHWIRLLLQENFYQRFLIERETEKETLNIYFHISTATPKSN